MSIDQRVTSALTPVLATSFSSNLPPNPTWPSIVFKIETQPESGWVLGGGYEQHTVSVIILAKTKGEIATLREQVKSAMKQIIGYLSDGDSGDAEYESDASVYGYYTIHVIRMRQ
jgi:hypothetical protein